MFDVYRENVWSIKGKCLMYTGENVWCITGENVCCIKGGSLRREGKGGSLQREGLMELMAC